MKVRKLLLLALVGAMVSVSACSTTHNNSADDEAAISDANDSGVKTAGLNQGEGFNGQDSGQHSAMNKNTYYFDFDRSDIRDADKPAIQAKGSNLAANPDQKITVQGHTDPRGSREYNVALGERRANSVANMLKENGASPSQVRVVSYGAQRLAATGHTEEDYQQDRRAELAN